MNAYARVNIAFLEMEQRIERIRRNWKKQLWLNFEKCFMELQFWINEHSQVSDGVIWCQRFRDCLKLMDISLGQPLPSAKLPKSLVTVPYHTFGLSFLHWPIPMEKSSGCKFGGWVQCRQEHRSLHSEMHSPRFFFQKAWAILDNIIL